MHKRLLLAAIAIPLLASCNRGTTVSYQLQIDSTDIAKREELMVASQRVVERRLSRTGIEPDVSLQKGDAPTLTVTVPDRAVAIDLENELTTPFSLELMRQSGTGDTVDFESDVHGKFTSTGITDTDIDWVQSNTHPLTGKGRVKIIFTAGGQDKVTSIFKENQGNEMALLVRGVLVSKLATLPTEIVDSIIIEDIPTPEIGLTFADDVNVGRFVTFSSSQ